MIHSSLTFGLQLMLNKYLGLQMGRERFHAI
jgi:hypothetical protein